MIRNIIFDWSGTLVDDLPAVWKATNYVLAQAERAEMTLEQFRAEFCLPFTSFYERTSRTSRCRSWRRGSTAGSSRCRIPFANCRTPASSSSSAAQRACAPFC